MHLYEKLIIGAVAAGVVTVAVMYYTGKLSIVCNKLDNYQAKLQNLDACSYLTESVQGTSDGPQIVDLCGQYQKICGSGSTTSEILSLSNLDPSDPDGSYLNALQQDVVSAKLNSGDCEPLLPCNTKKHIQCPPFLQCNSGKCS